MKLDGAVAIVTGAARGTGRGLAMRLARGGASVVAVDIDAAGLARTDRLIQDAGGTSMAEVADVTSADAARAAVEAAETRLGHIDILINNAGGVEAPTYPRAEADRWQQCLRLNLHGPMLMMQAALPAMVRAGGGTIVNMSSVAGVVNGVSPFPEYAAAKAGLIRLTEAVSNWMERHRVRVNCVAPNFILTDEIRAMLDAMAPAERDAMPPPISTIEEVAEAIVGLIEDDTVNGRCLVFWFEAPHLAPPDRVRAWLPSGAAPAN
jgi:NAD(P)-dependent dehydrogenase (short-subunit alcohol dehydrogenase family)